MSDNEDFIVKLADRVEVMRKKYTVTAIKERDARIVANSLKQQCEDIDAEIAGLRAVIRGLEFEIEEAES